MCIIGYVITFFSLRIMCNKMFKDYQFERFIAMWGSDTGVFMTGIMLLKICDPNYESPVLNDYSMGFSLTSISGFVLMAVFVNLMLTFSSMTNFFIHIGVTLVYTAIAIVGWRLSKASDKAAVGSVK